MTYKWPIRFKIYPLPLGDIIRKHGLKFHMYADDCVYFILQVNKWGSI